MSAASITTTTSARLGMMLTDLRLPTIEASGRALVRAI